MFYRSVHWQHPDSDRYAATQKLRETTCLIRDSSISVGSG